MGAPWAEGSARSLVGYLTRRIKNREQDRDRVRRAELRQARNATLGRTVAATALLLAVGAIIVADDPAPARSWTLGLLLGAPLLAAIAGAVIWDSFGHSQHWGKAAVRGLGAGVVSVLLYVATQLLAVPKMLDQLDVRRLLFFMIPVGFAAGLTFDLVYERLRNNPNAAPNAEAPANPTTV